MATSAYISPGKLKSLHKYIGAVDLAVRRAFAPGPTATEIAAGVTVVDHRYDEGVFNRYGKNTTPGTTIMTSAIQAAVNVMIQGGTTARGLSQRYLIDAPITIPFRTGWTIRGESMNSTIIEQATDNVPIFKFTGTNYHSWAIREMLLKHSSVQSGNTAAIAIAFEGDDAQPSIAYNYDIERIFFDNCYYCIGLITDGVNQRITWGGRHKELFIGAGVAGGVVHYVPDPVFGQPNHSFRDIYIRADKCTQPLFNLIGAHPAQFDNIEANLVNNGVPFIKATAGSEIACGMIWIEGASYSTANQGIFEIADSRMQIREFRIFGNVVEFDPGAGNSCFIFGFAGGSNGLYKVEYLQLANFGSATTTVSTGNLFVSDAGAGASGTGNRVEIGDFRVADLPGGAYLTDIPASRGADFTKVLRWNEPRISADNGDEDLTIDPGVSEKVQRFDTDLTANRTVTFPTPTGDSNLFNGLSYIINRTGGGAFALEIEDSTGTIDTIASGETGSIEVMYFRTEWRVVARSVS